MIIKPKLPYKNMDRRIEITGITHVRSKDLNIGDTFTFFDPRLILPSYYEVTEKLDFGVKVYRIT